MQQLKILGNSNFLGLNSSQKADKILSFVRLGNIVVIDGKLGPEDEMEITNKSLKKIDSKFSGIEIAHIYENNTKKEDSLVEKLKQKLVYFLAKDKIGITLVGPSKKIKEVKMNPSKLEIDLK